MQFSPKHFSNFLRFWIFILGVSVVAGWFFVSGRDSGAQSEVVPLDSRAQAVPLLFPPHIIETIPAQDAGDVLLGIEDPLVVRFATSVKDSHIRFALKPEAELLYENNPEKTEFRLLPKEPLQEGTRYTLNISYVSRETSDAAYRPLLETNFTTAVVPKVAGASTSVMGSETVARRTEGKYIDVDIARQSMVLFEEGRVRGQFTVSSGKPGMDTPKGTFSVQNKAPRPWSQAYGLYMPYWMAFTADGKFGIHELPEWPGGYKEGANHLGHPVSHGCIRLGVGAAQEVYEWADMGTPIVIH